MKTALVRFLIKPDTGAIRDSASPVYDCFANVAIAADINVWKDHRIFNGGERMHPYLGKQQRVPNPGSGHNTAPGHHGIHGSTPAVLIVKNELGRRQLLLIGPDWPVSIVKIQFGAHVYQLKVRLPE